MNTMKLTRVASAIVCTLVYAAISPAYSQELTLFQPFETENEAGASSSAQPSDGARAVSGDPVFRLLGTMRIGDSRQIHLRHRSGEVVKVSMAADFDGSMSIPGYQGFAVTSGGSQQVAITLPANEICQVYPDSGISCRDASTAELALVLGNVVQPQAAAVEPNDEEENAEAAPDNPFARIRAANAADNPASDPNPQRFRPRRIPPEDVPEGMRVISTPFGDRLVQE